MTIPSPYYFVPLSGKIFFPPWAVQVSMDVPFRQGISGAIMVKVTTTTPIYTRNGGVDIKGKPKNKKTKEYNEFFRVIPGTGQYAINGTGFKGLIRGILEIASFGKFRQVEIDRSFAFRELKGPNSKEYTKRLTTEQRPHEAKSKAGWLRQRDDGEWEIEKQEFARVEIEHLAAFHPSLRGNPRALFRKQTAEEKYASWGPALDIPFSAKKDETHDHSCGGKNCTNHSPENISNLCLKYKKACQLGTGTEQTGRIVFTGQPQNRFHAERHRKHMEFIFYAPKDSPSRSPLSVSAELRKQFLQLHSLPNGNPNPEWAYWKKKLEEKREAVPIFYLPEEASDKPKHIGLAMMFRLPCEVSVADIINKVNPDHLEAFPLDLAEVMLGQETGGAGLRGRISIEPLLETSNRMPEYGVITTLNEPRKSYYPNYLKQNVNTNSQVIRYSDYNDRNARPNGRKNYPVAHDGYDPLEKDIAPENKRLLAAPNSDMVVTFCPLPAGSVFEGLIHIHNLRPEELGALIWAMTWGGNTDLRHNIGMAKPFGFGSCKVEIDWTCLISISGDLVDINGCQGKFIKMMDRFLGGNGDGKVWQESEQIQELLALANPKRHEKNSNELFKYPVLDPQAHPPRNDFARFKEQKKALLRFRQQTGEENP